MRDKRTSRFDALSLILNIVERAFDQTGAETLSLNLLRYFRMRQIKNIICIS
jgi:hypothetical protein